MNLNLNLITSEAWNYVPIALFIAPEKLSTLEKLF